jgi:hypothetical protein
MANMKIEIDSSDLDALAERLAGADKKSLKTARDKIVKKLLAKPLNRKKLRSFKASGIRLSLTRFEEDLMTHIVYGISRLSGWPTGSIKSTSKLDELGLSATKLNQLRVYVNRFINENGGTVFISVNGMAGLKTVRELFDAANALIP